MRAPNTNNIELSGSLRNKVSHGDCGKAAEMLGVSRSALYFKMVRFGLTSMVHAHTTTATNGFGPSHQEYIPVAAQRTPVDPSGQQNRAATVAPFYFVLDSFPSPP